MTITEHLESALVKMGVDVDALPDRLMSTLLGALCDNVGSGGGSGGSVQTDWNQTDETAADFLKNKPFGENLPGFAALTWDGDITGRPYVELDGQYLVHVSDIVPYPEDFEDGGAVLVATDVGDVTIPFDSVVVLSENFWMHESLFFCVVLEDNLDAEGIVFPAKGIYFQYLPLDSGEHQYTSVLAITGYTGFKGLKKLDEKYLPDLKAVVLYSNYNEDVKYLYSVEGSTDAGDRVTTEQLRAYMLSGVSLLVYCNAFYYVPDWILLNGTNGGYIHSSAYTFRTAEYVPETTT